MLRSIRSYVTVLLLASCFLSGLFSFEVRLSVGAVSSLPVHNINTGLDYATIQEAVDANETLDGHTILVDAGTYFYPEGNHILIDKSLTLRGSGSQNTILNLTRDNAPPGRGWGMMITTSNVLLEGFMITAHTAPTLLVYVFNSLCTNITIRDNIFVGAGSDALDLRNTERSRVTNNLFFCTNEAFGIGSGIGLLTSNFNFVSNNTIHGGWASIVCEWGASNNTIVYNTITDETLRDGFAGAVTMAQSAHGNLFVANNLTHNEVAIWYATLAADPSNNIFYHNNFINNSLNIQFSSDIVPNAYDDGYPVGGNFWSAYTGNDTLSGPNQNQPGSDGFGDTPYIIFENLTDGYPLMRPYAPPRGDVNLDGVVNIMDASRLATAYGSHLGSANWNDLADIIPDGSINIYDAIGLGANFGQRGIQ